MLTQVKAYMAAHAMTVPGDKIMVALSGGMDSVSLLHVLLRLRESLGIEVCAAHLDHAIRPESQRDAELVFQLCQDWGVELISRRTDVARYADRHKVSLEVGAREVRHAFLSEAAAVMQANKIALAHHGNDQAETMLMRLARGTGLTGLCAMAPVNGRKIRPLLNTSSEQIQDYAQRHRLHYCLDVSNLDISIPRNRVRRQVMPQLERINPAAAQNIAAASELFRMDEDCLHQMALSAMAGVMPQGTGFAVPVAHCRALHPAIMARMTAMILARMGVDRDVTRVHQAAIRRLMDDGMTGKRLYLPSGVCALREAERLVFEHGFSEPLPPPEMAVQFPGSFNVPGRGVVEGRWVSGVRGDIYAENIGRTRWQLINADALPEDLMWRTRRKGDRMTPLGAPGSRKLSDILIDRKVSRMSRDDMLMLASGQRILWIPRMNLVDEALRVDAQTARVMRLSYTISDTEELNDEPFDALRCV